MTKPPPHAILCWADDVNVYAELPCTDGSYHRATFALSDAGLAKALTLLRSRKPIAPLPPTAKITRVDPLAAWSPAQSAIALKLLSQRHAR